MTNTMSFKIIGRRSMYAVDAELLRVAFGADEMAGLCRWRVTTHCIGFWTKESVAM